MRRKCIPALVLAAILACPAAWAGGDDTSLPKPVEVRAKLLTGGSFAGTADRWSLTTLSGSFGTRAWRELAAPDLKRLFEQVMDRRKPDHWLALAELLDSSVDGHRLASECYRAAERAGATTEVIEATRTRAAATRAARQAREQAESERRLKPTGATPTADTPAPWTDPTDDERREALANAKRTLERAAEVASVKGAIVESSLFLISGAAEPAELEQLGRELDAAAVFGAQVLGLPATPSPFVGKPTVLVLGTEDSFGVAEAALYGTKVKPGQRTALHTSGRTVALTGWRGTDPAGMRLALLQDLARGLLHQAHSGAALPSWVTDGFAVWLARGSELGGTLDRSLRPVALQALRGGSDVRPILVPSADAAWSGPETVRLAVSYLAVDFVIAERPRQFGAWIAAMKAGRSLDDASRSALGSGATQLMQAVVNWYRTNDGVLRR